MNTVPAIASRSAVAAEATTNRRSRIQRAPSPRTAENRSSSTVSCSLTAPMSATIASISAGLAVPGLHQGVEPVAIGDELVDQPVALRPDRDRLVDVAHLAEDPERGDQRRDVGRMVAPLGEPGGRDVEVGIGLLQLDPGDLVAARNGDRLEIRLVFHLVLRPRIADQVEDRVLLALAVEPFAADVGPNAGLDLQAEVDDREEPDGGDHEKGDARPTADPTGDLRTARARAGQMTPPTRSVVAGNHTPVGRAPLRRTSGGSAWSVLAACA